MVASIFAQLDCLQKLVQSKSVSKFWYKAVDKSNHNQQFRVTYINKVTGKTYYNNHQYFG